MRPFLIITCLLVFVSCKPRLDDSIHPVITLERRPCFGYCPVYHLKLYRDGRVQYEGRDFVSVRGRRDTVVHADSVEMLLQEAETIGYFDMLDKYHGRVINDTLIETITDQPSAVTSVRRGSIVKSIDNYFGGPERLRQFELHIDRVVNIVRWIGS